MTAEDRAGRRARLSRAIAAAGLPGTLTVLPAKDDDDGWRAVVNIAAIERLTGVLLAAVDAGAAEPPEHWHEELVSAHAAAMVRVLRLEALMLEVCEALARGGVESVILKGSAVARLDYANASQRSFGDVDVMVPADTMDVALQILGRLGFQRAADGIGRTFDRRFGKGVTLRDAHDREVDLHRTFVMGRYGLSVDLTEAWAEREAFEVAGTTLWALSPERRLLHAAYHATLGDWPPKMAPLRDIAEMVLYGRWDDLRLRRLATSWSAEAVLATAVTETWTCLELQDATGLSVWAQRFEPSASERRLLALHRESHGSYLQQQKAALTALPWRDRVAFGVSLAVPSREFLQSRGTTLPRHLLRSLARGLSR